jgi:hypothetical protein
MEAACTVYPSELGREVGKVAQQTKNPKNFAMAIHYLLRLHPKKAHEYNELLHRKFANAEQDPWLSQLERNLEIPFEVRLNSRPPMLDLLRQRFPGDAPVIFSFQRRNRDYPGLTVIRKSDGAFVRRPDGSMFSVPQLARSMSNCPGYLTNGNTPQGIFSIQGIEPADNSFIGPTPTLQTVLPIEKSVPDYFHDQSKDGTKWDRKLYQDMLPASWREYVPIFEAYAAGEVGRGDIITHGTTIDPEFYKGLTYYPNTPSMGCLTALEMWSPKDGRCIYSDQLSLLDAYTSLNHPAGFLVVVELDNESRSVYLYDVLPYLLDAESH